MKGIDMSKTEQAEDVALAEQARTALRSANENLKRLQARGYKVKFLPSIGTIDGGTRGYHTIGVRIVKEAEL
jgi:hypothetical protein